MLKLILYLLALIGVYSLYQDFYPKAKPFVDTYIVGTKQNELTDNIARNIAVYLECTEGKPFVSGQDYIVYKNGKQELVDKTLFVSYSISKFTQVSDCTSTKDWNEVDKCINDKMQNLKCK